MQEELYIYYDKQHIAMLLIVVNIPCVFLKKMEQKTGVHRSLMSRLATVCGFFVVM
jgi:hypothetical protein